MVDVERRANTVANPGAGAVVASLILLVGAAALQLPGPMLASVVVFGAAVVYRVKASPERALGAERRQLAISPWSLVGLLGGSFAFFVVAALFATR